MLARSVSDGRSPKMELYMPANRPSSKKPYSVAILVTVASPDGAAVNACRTASIRRRVRYRFGLVPQTE